MPLGFTRTHRQPARDVRAAARAQACAFVASEIEPGLGAYIETELAFLRLTTDCVHPDGHIFRASCGSVACVHENCGRVVWL